MTASQAETATTQSTDPVDVLADQIFYATGYDPRHREDAALFDLRRDAQCVRCGEATTTALIDDSSNPSAKAQRLCLTCTDWL